MLVGGPFLLALGVTAVLQYTLLANPVLVEAWLKSFGLWFIAVYIVAQTLSIVIPPIGGLVFQLAAISILGPLQGIVIGYLVTTPALCINFFLARRFGRPLVLRVLGKEGMKKLDDVFRDAGVGTLLILKVLQGGYFDYIAYAAGLSKISWKEFLLVNFLGGIPYSIIAYLIFLKAKSLIQSVIILQIFAALLIAIYVAYNHFKHTKNPGT